jgi:hypothetical protein
MAFLEEWQKAIFESYTDDKPFVNHYGRKGWESKYDPKFTKGTAYQPRRTPPDVSSLPERKWVEPRYPRDAEESLEFSRDMKAWLVDRKVKYQICEVMLDKRPATVYLFKKANDALMFKLTWG